MENKTPFLPVRGKEQDILNSVPSNGVVWFATDTRKIYYSNGTEFISMGGNSGIYYGQMTYDETPSENQTQFDFKLSDIEGNNDDSYVIPHEDDLVFNIPDHCFYRVVSVDNLGPDSTFVCTKLAVAGGGGGSGSGESSSVGKLTFSRQGTMNINVLKGQPCYIKFYFSAVDSSGESTGDGIYSIKLNNVTKASGLKAKEGENIIDISKYLENESNIIYLEMEADIGDISLAKARQRWNITVTNLGISWNYNDNTINSSNNLNLNWEVTTSLAHTAYIDIDSLITIEVPFSAGGSIEKSYLIENRQDYGLTHGAHNVELYVKVEIDGTIYESSHLKHTIICVDEDRNDTIIALPFIPSSVNQYDTVSIPIIVYNPVVANIDNKISIILRENGINVDTWTDYENGKIYYWNYSANDPGEQILSILSGGAEKTIRLEVIDLQLNISEDLSYEFKLKASDIISNSNLQNWTFRNNINLDFSPDFDWTNGGLKSEENNGIFQNYILVKAGDYFRINYNPFAAINNLNGFSIKIIFKTSNCRIYDASAISIGTPDNRGGIYLQIKANEAIYKTVGEEALTVPYCEDSYIEFEIDIDKNTNPYIMTWLDGVPTSVQTYSTGQFATDFIDNITIGSVDCDVSLYLIKVYQKHLTNNEHLNNFILDAPTTSEIITRYNRNDILDSNREISYQKLIEKNPNCDVYLYEIPRMTLTKKDKVNGCTYQRFKGKLTAEQTAENVTIAVQGTSSARYGLSAFNFNSTFNDGLMDYSENVEGIHVDKWAMNKNAIPVNVFNTKVNVASCEGVNNALNQAWYERFVPYVTEYKQQNPKSRNTIEFMNMGVVFIKDHNPEFDNQEGVKNNVFNDTADYINNPYYKMYSICNMGNVKGNEEVFSNLDNPYDVIMENSDNQSIYQHMTGYLKDNKLYGEWDGDKFYPILIEDTYFETADTKAVEGKQYFYKSNNNYLTVRNLSPGDDISELGYYEFYKAGSRAPTEVFEWRTVPSKTWSIMDQAGLKDATMQRENMINFRDQAQRAWTGLVEWFARNNPEAATGARLPAPEHYDAYIFKGYTSRADRIDKDGNLMPVYSPDDDTQILKGLSISRYANTYEYDTKERRMAKMLNECEDHLIMDEIVFHYLFIERHSLIDNVAKNTFWHTEDLQHWSMIKDYDNDTSDGNDNSGHLTLTYGYEVLDHVNHDPSQSFVFNAAPSVWLHFVDNLIEARTRMFQELDKKDAWKASIYLDKFNEWQSLLPERVWIEDYYRKYIRPKNVYGNAKFLSMLEGGKKTHQRKQFEIYQEAYMSSEYNGIVCQSTAVDIRANGEGIKDMVFPITMYTDCYIRVAAGSGNEPNVRERYHRGEVKNIRLPVTGNANDMTTYFFLANYITSLQNIEMLKPKVVDVSQAFRLREFSMKQNDNEQLNTFYIKTEDEVLNPNKEYYQLSFEKVEDPIDSDINFYYELDNGNYILTNDRNIDDQKDYYLNIGFELVENPLNALKDNYYEKFINAENLNLTEAIFENNKMLEKLEVMACPRARNSLNLANVTNLKYLDVTGSGFRSIILAPNSSVQTLNLNNPELLRFNKLYHVNTFNLNCENLNSLDLNDIDNTTVLNSKNLVEQSNQDRVLLYNLQNVKWIINEPGKVTDNNILILDRLINDGQSTDFNKTINRALALTGTLIITQEAYNGDKSLELYNKYIINNYPNLDLIFEGSNAKLFNIYITDGNDNIVWEKKAKSNYEINSEFLSTGPKGGFNLDLISNKTNTAEKIYEFANQWEIFNAVTNEKIGIINNSQPIYTEQLSQDVIIKPIFTERIRTYSLFLHIQDTMEEINDIPYGTIVINKLQEIYPFGPYISDNDLILTRTYKFIGWRLRPTSGNFITDESVVLMNDLNIYAYFEEIDVHDNINLDLFNYTYYGDDNSNNSFNINNQTYEVKGIYASPKNSLALKGKITIPDNDPNGNPIVGLTSFNECINLTHLFFARNSQIQKINSGCFQNLSNLIYLEPNNSIKVIEAFAFHSTHLRIDLQNEDYIIGGNNLLLVGREAFRYSLYSNTFYRTVIIPSSVVAIETGAFSTFTNLENKNCVIQIGSNTNPSQWNVLANTDSYGSSYLDPASWARFYQNNPIGVIFYTNQYNSWNQRLKTFLNEEILTLVNCIADRPQNLSLIRLNNNGVIDDWVES